MKPYTESANPITTDIDISAPERIVEKLQQCDLEMFQPSDLDETIQTLYHDGIVKSIFEVAKLAKNILDEESRESLIVMSGCGTSGRIAFMMARTYNSNLKTRKFAYTIAGGDKALFTSQEAPEDDQQTGRDDLIKACQGKQRVLYIGITCGLSAPYVAGQLDHCMGNPDVFTPVLIGFNPIKLARNVPIYGWDKTFLNVAEAFEVLSKNGKAHLINPVLQGEPITGSSRMKGGSITKVILDTIFMLATSSRSEFTASNCKEMLQSYSAACKHFYQSASSLLSSLLSSAGDSLKAGGHLYYVSSGGSGVLGIIDATECAPTYGSDLNDVRGFIKGGYSEYDNNEGDISSFGENYCIATTDLASLLASRDQSPIVRDTIIVIIKTSDDPILQDLQESSELGRQLKVICEEENRKTRISVVKLLEDSRDEPVVPKYLDEVTTLRFPSCDILPDFVDSLLTSAGRDRYVESVLECWAKWLYNCTSTGAHILKGKVLKNYMVDLKVSNQKLFHRSIGIIQRFCSGLSEKEARNYLLRSIYEINDVDVTLTASSVSTHIEVATPKDKIVPTAIVMANKKCNFDEAQILLDQYFIISKALANLTN